MCVCRNTRRTTTRRNLRSFALLFIHNALSSNASESFWLLAGVGIELITILAVMVATQLLVSQGGGGVAGPAFPTHAFRITGQPRHVGSEVLTTD